MHFFLERAKLQLPWVYVSWELMYMSLADSITSLLVSICNGRYCTEHDLECEMVIVHNTQFLHAAH